MKTRLFTLICSGVLATLAASAYAYDPLVEGKVPFAFVAGNSVLPAGNYEIGVADPTTNILEIKSHDTSKAWLVPYVTRLSARGDEKSLLVFDVQGDKKYLSELFAPPEDAFALEGARGMHTHETVSAQRKRK
jgi:hypothetical protein